MSEWRRSKMLGKRDESEPEIVRAFLAAGASVAKHSNENEGDLIVGFLGMNHWVECKTGNAQISKGQADWAKNWKGEKPLVIRTEAHARKAIRIWTLAFADESRREAGTFEVRP